MKHLQSKQEIGRSSTECKKDDNVSIVVVALYMASAPLLETCATQMRKKKSNGGDILQRIGPERSSTSSFAVGDDFNVQISSLRPSAGNASAPSLLLEELGRKGQCSRKESVCFPAR